MNKRWTEFGINVVSVLIVALTVSVARLIIVSLL